MKYDVDFLSKIGENYLEEARKCNQNKYYVSSFIMYGAALEGVLLAMCCCYPARVRTTKTYKKVKGRSRRKRAIFLNLSLSQLISIAKELNWLPFKEKIEDIGTFENWVRFVQETRNLVHPGRWLKPSIYFIELPKLMRKPPYRKYQDFAEICDETVSGICLLLANKVEEDLAKKIKRLSKK